MGRWLRRALLLLAALALPPILFIAVVVASLRPPPPAPLPARGADLSDVTLIVPGLGRQLHRRVIIEGERIANVGEASPRADDPFVGAFVIPGLTDMHVHWPPPAIPGQIELFAFLHLLHGVTTVRSLGDTFEGASEAARSGVEAGRFPGPRVLSCGPIIDGDPPLWRGSRVVHDGDEARAAARALAEEGVDCLKAYDGLDAESLAGLREAGRALDLPVVGHTPRRVSFEAARLDDVQHLRGVHPPFEGEVPRYPFFLAAWERLDEAHLRFVVETSRRHGIAHTPTLVTVDRLVASRDYRLLTSEPAYRLLPRWYRDGLWDGEVGLNATRLMKPADYAMVARAFEQMLVMVRRLHEAGVRIHSGTDTMAPAVVPGAALHRELALLVRAGLSPEEALEVSTRSSPAFLGIPGLGELRSGAPAELLILRRDPTRDLAALGSIAGVVRGGRLFTREALEHQRALYQARFDGVGQRLLLTGAVRLALGRLMPAFFGGTPADRGEAAAVKRRADPGGA